MLKLETVRALCAGLGYIGADGDLKQLDSLQQVELLIEAEQVLGIGVTVSAIAPEVFFSLAALHGFLDQHGIKK